MTDETTADAGAHSAPVNSANQADQIDRLGQKLLDAKKELAAKDAALRAATRAHEEAREAMAQACHDVNQAEAEFQAAIKAD